MYYECSRKLNLAVERLTTKPPNFRLYGIKVIDFILHYVIILLVLMMNIVILIIL